MELAVDPLYRFQIESARGSAPFGLRAVDNCGMLVVDKEVDNACQCSSQRVGVTAAAPPYSTGRVAGSQRDGGSGHAVTHGASDAEALGAGRRTVQDWAYRYNTQGPDGLRGRRRGGKYRQLSPAQEQRICDYIDRAAAAPFRPASAVGGLRPR
jgi:hypothetical protein